MGSAETPFSARPSTVGRFSGEIAGAGTLRRRDGRIFADLFCHKNYPGAFGQLAAALREAADALRAVSDGLDRGIPSDLLAEDLRAALASLGSITGLITTDEVLGEIFSKFCIGK